MKSDLLQTGGFQTEWAIIQPGALCLAGVGVSGSMGPAAADPSLSPEAVPVSLGSDAMVPSLPLAEVLQAVVRRSLKRCGRSDLTIHLDLVVEGACPLDHYGAVLCAAAELVRNALDHGFYQRRLGRIGLRFSGSPAGCRLVVTDTGWGFDPDLAVEGRGLRHLRALGLLSITSTIDRNGSGLTTASLWLPVCPPSW